MMSRTIALRLVLILAVLLGPLAGPRAAADPALAIALAGGSLCGTDGPEGAPGAEHDHCLACQALGGWGGPVPATVVMLPGDAARAVPWPVGQGGALSRWRGYASRAPPGGVA
jgi:hypothetical protein